MNGLLDTSPPSVVEKLPCYGSGALPYFFGSSLLVGQKFLTHSQNHYNGKGSLKLFSIINAGMETEEAVPQFLLVKSTAEGIDNFDKMNPFIVMKSMFGGNKMAYWYKQNRRSNQRDSVETTKIV